MPQRLTLVDLKTKQVGVWDLETVSLNASFGHILCGTFMPLFGKKKDCITYTIAQSSGYKDHIWDDSWLVSKLVEEASKYEVLIGYNSLRFDASMLNTRALFHKQKLLPRDMKHMDLYRYVKEKLRMGGRSLDALLVHLTNVPKQYQILPRVWRQATCGDQACFAHIVKRNISDVVSTARVAKRLLKVTWLPYCYSR